MLIELVSCLFVAMPMSTYLLVAKCMQGMGVELRHEIELQCHAQVFHKKKLTAIWCLTVISISV